MDSCVEEISSVDSNTNSSLRARLVDSSLFYITPALRLRQLNMHKIKDNLT